MRHLVTAILWLAVLASNVLAQDPRAVIPRLPPALHSALDRIGKSATSPSMPKRLDVQSASSLRDTCSIPLLEMRIGNPERFTIKQSRVRGYENRMPLAPMPAPPCKRR